ncbi:MAG: chitin deacetylase [Candelina mexicana]|nr:MAG: chitin deacetylase [Candelina mexicana]
MFERGCQTGFGDCTAPVSGNGDGTCGPAFGNARCPSGLCCSPSGYCGTTQEFCADPDCQYPFGTCDSNKTPAGASTANDPRPKLGSVSYSDDIYNCVEANVVALTYDDGPYQYTNQLLDVLAQFGFKATFFMTGNNLGKGPIDTTAPYPTIIKRMIADGHQVASHTWSHYSLDKIGHDLRIDQMTKNERAIANIIGKYPTYMRPPFSQCSAASGCAADMEALGYHRISFDLDTQDYLNPLPTQIQNSKDIVNAALAGSAGDYLSIQHDIVEQSVTNLTSYYYGLIKAKGWKGVTAGECLGDPESNWYRGPGGAGLSVSPASTTASSGTLSATLSANVSVSATVSSQSSTSVSGSPPSPTSGVSSTSSTASSTATVTTSSAPSSTISLKPTSTQSSTSIAVPPASTCAVESNKFCGKVLSFGDKKGCFKSAGDCYLQNAECYLKAGAKNFDSCKKWNNICNKLTLYCTTCGFQCASTKFSP